MKKLLLLSVIFAGALSAQVSPTNPIQFKPTPPSGACSSTYVPLNWLVGTGPFYYCDSTLHWHAFTGGGGGSFVLTTLGSSGAATFDGAVLNIPIYSGGGSTGTVTSVAWPTIPSWLTVTISNPTTAASISVVPTTAQTSHQVIGTCGSATTFAPCALVLADLPSGTVTVVGAGNLTSTALVTGGGTQTLQTPSATSTLDSSGNMTLAGKLTATSIASGSSPPTGITYGTAGAWVCGEGTAFTGLSTGQSGIYCDATTNLFLELLNGGSTAYALLGETATDTTTTHVLHASATGGVGTFSAIAAGDLPAALSGSTSVNGTTIPASATLITSTTTSLPSVTSVNGTTIPASGTLAVIPAITVHSSGSPYSLAGVTGLYYNNTASTYSWTLDAPTAGKQYCFGNYSARTGALTITSTTSVYIVYKGANGTVTTGTLVSGGAAGDFICLVGVDSTHYMAAGAGYGTWTNN